MPSLVPDRTIVFNLSSTSSLECAVSISAPTFSGSSPLACDEFQDFISTVLNDRVDDQQIEALPVYESEKNVVLSMLKSHFPNVKWRSFSYSHM